MDFSKKRRFGSWRSLTHFGSTEEHDIIILYLELPKGFHGLFSWCCVTDHNTVWSWVASYLCNSLPTGVPTDTETLRDKSEDVRLSHLIWIVDCDLEASEDLPGGRMLVHGDLKLALRAVLSVKGWRMVVEVHHPDRHRRNVIVQQLTVLP